jgi:hypothetical protein
MTFKLFPHRSSAGSARRTPRRATGKRHEPERPTRVYSLLLPPSLPRDRR